jgi:chorismate mutase/prephenate dehydratase
MAQDRDDLDDLRARINDFDTQIVDAVAERQRVVEALATLKAERDLPLRDVAREEQELTRLGALAVERGVNAHVVRRVFREIMDGSLRLQQQHLIALHNPEHLAKRHVVVAYQGTDGAYSQIAAEQHFANFRVTLECNGYDSFAAMLQAVADGAADYGMLPIENTTAGSINEAYDLLAETDLTVVGEEVLRVSHCLVGLPGATLDGIRSVYSHPQALAQCSVYLGKLPNCAVIAFTDTAMAVKKVKAEADASQAAVASERAATLYGLSVVARNIQNQKDNFTRFMVVSRTGLSLDERIACKTSLIFSTRHEQGALVRCLNVLSELGLNLTKLESRPRPSSPFEYLFYVDFDGNLQTEPVQRAIERMRAHTNYMKVLGCYPAMPRAARLSAPRRAIR